MAARHRYQYTVRYRRAGWQGSQVRIFQSRPYAMRLVKKPHGAEWCRRVALVLDDSTNDQFGEWSQRALAPVLGIDHATLSRRIAWSAGVKGGGDHGRAVSPGGRKPEHQAGDARRFFNNPTVVGERKAQIVATNERFGELRRSGSPI